MCACFAFKHITQYWEARWISGPQQQDKSGHWVGQLLQWLLISRHAFLLPTLPGLRSVLMYFVTSSHLLPTWLSTCMSGFCYNHIYPVGKELWQKKFDQSIGGNSFHCAVIQTGAEWLCWKKKKKQSSVFPCSVSTHFANGHHGFEPWFPKQQGLAILLFARGEQRWMPSSLLVAFWDMFSKLSLSAVTNKKQMWLFLSILISVTCIVLPGM